MQNSPTTFFFPVEPAHFYREALGRTLQTDQRATLSRLGSLIKHSSARPVCDFARSQSTYSDCFERRVNNAIRSVCRLTPHVNVITRATQTDQKLSSLHSAASCNEKAALSQRNTARCRYDFDAIVTYEHASGSAVCSFECTW